MHAIRPVACPDKSSCRVPRYANDRICLAKRPGNAATPPIAVVDVHMDESLGPCEGGEEHACKGVARPVGGMQDFDPIAPDMSGQPEQARCRRQGARDAGKLL